MTSGQAVTVHEAGRALGVSVSTIWRMIRRGQLSSFRERGRRLVPRAALRARPRAVDTTRIPPLHPTHPIFRLVGAGRSGGRVPGARNKHAILDR